MSDMGLEAPDADAAEQGQNVIPDLADSEDLAEPGLPEELPLEANPADTAEQAREVGRDDEDEYR
jgi:hypothetical protein